MPVRVISSAWKRAIHSLPLRGDGVQFVELGVVAAADDAALLARSTAASSTSAASSASRRSGHSSSRASRSRSRAARRAVTLALICGSRASVRPTAARSRGDARPVLTRAVSRCRSKPSPRLRPQFLAQGVFLLQLGDGVEPGLDGGAVGQRRDDPLLQQPRAHRRRRAVQDRQQRAGPAAVAQGARQFQAAARHLVEEQKAVAGARPQAREMSEVRLERFLQVEQQRPGGGQARLIVVEAEAGQRGDAEVTATGRRGRSRRRRSSRAAA